ncbi:ankyrin-1-like [Belonocnema kinseyi]|uniref:ankyrin-1-like n=1 Tax=Belonocnema kinseyi TaxID=2817044 RepID=UPI00143D62B8|nr:ankyrin-1-like [Belonocnema kinseyi]
MSTIDNILDREINEKRLENIIPLSLGNISGIKYFYYAAATAKKELIELLLLRKINFNQHFERTGMTPLHAAIENGKVDIVKLLLQQGTDWTVTRNLRQFPFDTSTSSNGYTVLHMAAQKVHKEMINIFLEYGSFNCLFIPAGEHGYTHFHVAVDSEHEDVVKLFLEIGVRADCPTGRGFVSLYIAAQKGHETILQLLLKYDTPVDVVGQTSFELSTECNSILETYGIVDLTQEGRHWIIKWDEAFSPLYVASYHGHEKMVRTLLEKGADPNSSFEKGITPVHAAAQEGHKEIVDLPLKNGALANFNKSNQFSTPLIVAAKGGHEEIVKILLLHDADVKTKLRSPYRDFSKCIENVFSCENFPLCIEHGNGQMALQFAAKAGNKSVIDMLLKYGADVNECSDDGHPSIPIAVFENNVEILRTLLEAGGNMN